MKRVSVSLASQSPYSQSRMHLEPKLDKETAAAYERRVWREHCTTNNDNEICIPAMALKQCLDRVAVVLGMQIPGRGKNTYSKHFRAGCICTGDVPLGILKKDVESVTINANADGIRGSGKRVQRIYPLIKTWAATADFLIMDDTITEDVFEHHLIQAGQFVGIGRFRPENGGVNGRFSPAGKFPFKWVQI